MVLNYDTHLEKREVQKKILPLVKKSKIIVLGGPNLRSYLSMYPKRVKDVHVWEKDLETVAVQTQEIQKITTVKITCHYGDIFNAPILKNAFYDLDFCSTVVSKLHHLQKFRNCAFSATFCNWHFPVDQSIDLFLKAVGEKKIVDIPHPQFNLLKTNHNDYLYTTYRDSNQMMTIFKFH